MAAFTELPIDPTLSGFSLRSNLAVVEIGGAEATTFLSNQFAADINELDERHAQLSCWCDPKGRVLFLQMIVKLGDVYLCLLPSDAVEAFIKRLSMFVLRSDVQISNRSDSRLVAGIVFADSAPRHPEIEAEITQQFDAAHLDNGVISIRLDAERRRYLLVGDHEQIESINVAVGLDNIDAHWTLFDIAGGLPYLPTELSGEFLPQHLNLDALGGVSFNKGCYPGQEVIARLRYRGSVKKRLSVGVLVDKNESDTSPLVAGENIYATNEKQQKVGEVLYGARGAAVVVAGVEYLKGTSIAYVGDPAVPLRLMPAPYPVPVNTVND